MQHAILFLRKTQCSEFQNTSTYALKNLKMHRLTLFIKKTDEFESPAVGDSGPLSGWLLGTRSVITYLK